MLNIDSNFKWHFDHHFFYGIKKNNRLKDTGVLPGLGFDKMGKKSYDLGNQTVTVCLLPDLTYQIKLPDGGIADALPEEGADKELLNAAKSDFYNLQKTSEDVVFSYSDFLFERFLSAVEQPFKEWKNAYSSHILLKRIAGLVVWVQGKKTFTITNGSFIDSKEKEYTLTEKPVKVAHPVEMSKDDIARWKNYFKSRGLEQPFVQMDAYVYDLKSISPNRYEGAEIPFKAFVENDNSKCGFYIIVVDGLFPNVYIDDFEHETNYIEFPKYYRMDYFGPDPIEYYMLPFPDKSPRIEIKNIKLERYANLRRANNAIKIMDRLTIESHIKNDNLAAVDMIQSLTKEQLMNCIKLAEEYQSTDILEELIAYRDKVYGSDATCAT